jgi:hypothetical protein
MSYTLDMKVGVLLRRIGRKLTPPGNRGSLETEYRQPNMDPITLRRKAVASLASGLVVPALGTLGAGRHPLMRRNPAPIRHQALPDP